MVIKRAGLKKLKHHTGGADDSRNTAATTDMFCTLLQGELGLKVWQEFHFHPGRKWRFDYAIPSHKVAVEVEGGVWTQGRHTRGAGFVKDIEKYNEAAALGWTLIRTTPDELYSSKTIRLIARASSLISNKYG